MSKFIYDNNGVKLIKRKKVNFKKVKLFAFLLLCFACVVSVAGALSQALTIGSFSFFGLFKSDDVVFEEEILYFVNMDKFNNLQEAENMAEFVAMQGASAFIWQTDSDYVIVGNVYKTREEATVVLNNLQKTNPDVFVSEVEFKNIKLNLKDFSYEQKQVVQKAINTLNATIKNLYDITIKLETKELTPTSASSKVNEMKADSIITGNGLDLLNSVTLNESVIKLKNGYIKLTENLNELVLKLISSPNVNSISKYTYVQVLKLKYDLLINL